MANLTREQYEKMNKDNKNGFNIDMMALWARNVKNSVKDIDIGNNQLLRVTLLYRDEYIKTDGGYNMPTFKKIPCAHMSVYRDKNNGMMVSHGLGYWHNLGKAEERQAYKLLQKFTEELTDAKCLEIFEVLKATQVNQYA